MSKQQSILVRITPEAARRCDAVAHQMEQRMPGLRVTRTDAMRMALALGLELMEDKHDAD